MVLNQDFREFIEQLNAKEVKYLVVGGYAGRAQSLLSPLEFKRGENSCVILEATSVEGLLYLVYPLYSTSRF